MNSPEHKPHLRGHVSLVWLWKPHAPWVDIWGHHWLLSLHNSPGDKNMKYVKLRQRQMRWLMRINRYKFPRNNNSTYILLLYFKNLIYSQTKQFCKTFSIHKYDGFSPILFCMIWVFNLLITASPPLNCTHSRIAGYQHLTWVWVFPNISSPNIRSPSWWMCFYF